MNFGLIFSLNSSPAASFPPAIFQTGFEMWFTTQTREVLSPPPKKVQKSWICRASYFKSRSIFASIQGCVCVKARFSEVPEPIKQWVSHPTKAIMTQLLKWIISRLLHGEPRKSNVSFPLIYHPVSRLNSQLNIHKPGRHILAHPLPLLIWKIAALLWTLPELPPLSLPAPFPGGQLPTFTQFISKADQQTIRCQEEIKIIHCNVQKFLKLGERWVQTENSI